MPRFINGAEINMRKKNNLKWTRIFEILVNFINR